ncbi:hypothetical protein ACWEQL_27810 [Kitasatospora sp. NPDC004240]
MTTTRRFWPRSPRSAPSSWPPRPAVSSRALDRLAAHLRRAGTAVLTPGPWPGAHLSLRVSAGQWFGLGDGWGRLMARKATVEAVGRGSAARPRTAELWLPDEHGTVTAVENGIVAEERPQDAAAVVPA